MRKHERHGATAVCRPCFSAVFTARLRQTVDLDTVRGDLVSVVDQAFQPAHVSVWLAGTRQQARPGPTGRTNSDGFERG